MILKRKIKHKKKKKKKKEANRDYFQRNGIDKMLHVVL